MSWESGTDKSVIIRRSMEFHGLEGTLTSLESRIPNVQLLEVFQIAAARRTRLQML